MTLQEILAFLTFSVVAAITPGPSNIMVTATGAAVGFWRGLPCLLGVCIGMASLMFPLLSASDSFLYTTRASCL